MSDLSGPACTHHPSVGGVAQCVDCGVVLCGACSTRVRGRNICARCLANQLTAVSSSDDEQPGVALELLAAAAGALGVAALVALASGVLFTIRVLG